MPNELDPNLVSYLAKKTRISLGKTIKEVSFNVSAGTASHIETQEQKVTDKKVYAYLENLGISKDQVSHELETLKRELTKIKFKLELIYTMFDCGNLDQGYKKLNEIELDKHHPSYAYYKFLEARYTRHHRKWKLAMKRYHDSIEIFRKNNYSFDPTFIANVYNSLSVCAFYLDEIPAALNYVDLGLCEFDNTNNSPNLYYTLKRNQILYLERSGNHTQAFDLINKLWTNANTIDKVQVKLGFYKSRATLLLHAKQHNEAIECAKEGIRIARTNNELNRLFDLLNILGTIFMDMSNWEESASCFENVISYQSQGFHNKQADAHISLGILYAKQKHYDQSKKILNTALKICINNNIDIYRKCKVLIALGNVHRSQSNYIDAINYYDEVYQLSNEQDLPHIQHFVLYQSLSCFRALGKLSDFNKRNEELYLLQQKLDENKEVTKHEIPNFPQW